jgi:hypothetical protein
MPSLFTRASGVAAFVLATMISSPCIAAGPTADEAKQCVTKSDEATIAELWEEREGERKAHVCSEYFQLEKIAITDTSFAQNTADVMVGLRYTVIKKLDRNFLDRCLGKLTPMPTLPISIGTILQPKDRKISMQRWTSGWKCKDAK